MVFLLSLEEKRRSGSAQDLIGWLGFRLIEPDSLVIPSENECIVENVNHFHPSVFFLLFFYPTSKYTHEIKEERAAALAAVFYAQRASRTIYAA